MTLTATKILLSAWEKGAAKGLAQADSIFNEAIEKKWVEHWLFFANTTMVLLPTVDGTCPRTSKKWRIGWSLN
jgi:hypothetical protein